MTTATETVREVEAEEPNQSRQVALCEQELRLAELELKRRREDARTGRCDPGDVRMAEERVAAMTAALEEARSLKQEAEARLASLREQERAEREALKSPAQRKAEQDCVRRHKAAVRELRAAFARFLEVNDSLKPLEQEGATLGLRSLPIFSWGDFQVPAPYEHLSHISLWLAKTQEYIEEA